MKLILVCGPWSSGTSAIAGMFDSLGVQGMAPYWTTNDERTKNSFESIGFRNLLLNVIDENSVTLKVSRKEIINVIENFKKEIEKKITDVNATFFLKHPLAALLIPEIASIFETHFIFVLRPVREIEKTRERRSWHEHFGKKGAAIIYSQMFNALIEFPIRASIIKYPQLIKNPTLYAQQFAKIANVEDPVLIKKASDFIANHD